MQRRLTEALFRRIEALEDETLEGERLKDEIARSRAMVDLSSQITAARRLELDAWRALDAGGRQPTTQMLTDRTLTDGGQDGGGSE